MKFLYTALLSVSLLQMAAQCPVCTPDETCVSSDGFPTICPSELPAAVSGVYYEQYLTFYLPAIVHDPETDIDATLLSVTITSVTGLPFGMAYTINDDDNTYHPSQGENFGCATICGTAILPGVYDVVISVSAVATAIGFEINQDLTYTYTIVVEPGEGGTNSFSYDNGAGCGSLTVNYDAELAGVSPQVTNYYWNFGNGETSELGHPSPVLYNAPGEYTVSLNTVISNVVLDSVHVSSLNDNWGGDEDFFASPGDPYFTLNDGSGVLIYTSTNIDNVTSAGWGNLAIALTNPPYTITFWDDDVFSVNDNLGSSVITIAGGASVFNMGNGTSGTLNIELDEVNDIVDTSVITVFEAPVATYTHVGNTLTCTDGSLETYVWTLNGVPIDGADGPSIVLGAGGNYSVTVGNIYGCSATSASYLHCPSIVPEYDHVTDEVSVPDIYLSYQWYLNGSELSSENASYIIDPENGEYTVEVSTSYGCTTLSQAIDISVGIEEQHSVPFGIYPNPVRDQLSFLKRNVVDEKTEYSITDISGRNFQSGILLSDQKSIDVSTISSGVYFLNMWNGTESFRLRFVKE